jgi:GH43 family beta-xylosidase
MKRSTPTIAPILTALTSVATAILVACGGGSGCNYKPETVANPILEGNMNTCVTFHGGRYYFAQNSDGKLFLRVAADPADLAATPEKMICDMQRDHGLVHMWRPCLVNIDNVWYLYTTADDGNTDNHQLYVLANDSPDPLQGEFRMLGRVSTDPDNNWAIHASVFNYRNQLYMIWSGWVTRRVFAETQCIFIAKMKDPWTIDGPRVLISKPEHEWECQWVNADGSMATAYPLFVNESPTFLCDQSTDRVYIYYSASANWTPHTAIGELSASKDADLLDPASWTKRPHPVMKQDRQTGIYGPGSPCVVPAPDGSQLWLIYKAKDAEIAEAGREINAVYMKPIEIDSRGVPDPGRPATRGKTEKYTN